MEGPVQMDGTDEGVVKKQREECTLRESAFISGRESLNTGCKPGAHGIALVGG